MQRRAPPDRAKRIDFAEALGCGGRHEQNLRRARAASEDLPLPITLVGLVHGHSRTPDRRCAPAFPPTDHHAGILDSRVDDPQRRWLPRRWTRKPGHHTWRDRVKANPCSTENRRASGSRGRSRMRMTSPSGNPATRCCTILSPASPYASSNLLRSIPRCRRMRASRPGPMSLAE